MPSHLLSQTLSGSKSSKEVGERGAKVGGGEWVDRLVEVEHLVVWVVVVERFLVECALVCFEVLAVECFFDSVMEISRVLVVLSVELLRLSLVTSVVGLPSRPGADEVEISALGQSLQGGQSPH